MRFGAVASVTLLAAVILAFPKGIEAKPASSAYVRQAMSENPSESKEAIAALRFQGIDGVQAFFNAYKKDLQLARFSPTNPKQQKLRATLDAICQQRDCYASQLFWYTDLDRAKAAAKVTGKPILSLRLLGRLDADLSCANSRFFRIALYPNAQVSKVLRDRFILHWQSVRPAPKITIDFGDGRTLERTITGNSIHYVLDAQGRPIDALPGLYSPQAFLGWLSRSKQAHKEYSRLNGQQREEFLRQYHRDRLSQIQANWTADLSKLGISLPLPNAAENQTTNNPPTAIAAAPVAMTKMAVERPILRSMSEERQQVLQTATNDTLWPKIAELYLADARLDANSQALMRMKNFKYFSRNSQAEPDPLLRVLPNFERNIALDTVRNEYLLHTQLHEWFIAGTDTIDVNTLNEKVYAQLFLTPSADPWLGLLPNDAYTGIEGEGISIRN
ncbi:MAG: hypothetical protein KME17_29850 [Cyanosarcina radialis HA8281-LM2]|jgi:hypothetical protein|nr:hypothetical protein [Cyanosarcina radialis HA8281-LM2]